MSTLSDVIGNVELGIRNAYPGEYEFQIPNSEFLITVRESTHAVG